MTHCTPLERAGFAFTSRRVGPGTDGRVSEHKRDFPPTGRFLEITEIERQNSSGSRLGSRSYGVADGKPFLRGHGWEAVPTSLFLKVA